MFILGLQGSPRRKGNTDLLLSAFLGEAERLGVRTSKIEVAQKEIMPCQGCGICAKKGFCPVDDDMRHIYPMFRQADIVVMATPIFFYGPTAQMKALIDRSQVLWARRYLRRLSDPGQKWRQGFLLSLGATKGKNLFEGVSLTAKYFFDAIGAGFNGSLTYRQVEGEGEILKHPAAIPDAKEKASTLAAHFLKRKRVLFACTENACRSQMASAFARHYAGDKIDAESAGSAPVQRINPLMEEVMEEKGIDIAFCKPKSVKEAALYGKPDLIVSMGCKDACPSFHDVPVQEWNLPDPAGKSIVFMRKVRDDIEEMVNRFAQPTERLTA